MKQRKELLLLSVILTIITLFMSGAGDKIYVPAASKNAAGVDYKTVIHNK
jgi:hypothetical protein